MELMEVIKKRHSVRSFKEDGISNEILSGIVDLARLAPSAGAIRGYEVLISKERLESVLAPVYLIVCTNPDAYAKRYGDRGRNLYSVQDATILGAYLQLILVDRGLSSCWVGAFREEKVKKILNTSLRPIAIIAVGYKEENVGKTA